MPADISVDDFQIDRNPFDTLAQLTMQALNPERLAPGEIYAVPDSDGGQVVFDTDRYLKIPRNYPEYDYGLETVDALIGYLDTHEGTQGPDTEIWAYLKSARTGFSVRAYLDANTHRRQRVHLQIIETQRWTDWKNIDKKMLSQEAFAEFLEDHADDMVTPGAARMLEIAQTIRTTTGVSFEQGLRLNNGEVQFAYKEEIEGRAGKAGTLEIPQEITVLIQPFTASKAYKIKAKFRYRAGRDGLSLGIKFLNADRMIEEVYADTLSLLQKSAFPVYQGA